MGRILLRRGTDDWRTEVCDLTLAADHLEADGAGGSTCRTSARGDVELPPPGAGPDVFDGTLDCDLGLSPLTNLMPVRRPALHERAGSLDLDADGVVVRYPGLAERVPPATG